MAPRCIDSADLAQDVMTHQQPTAYCCLSLKCLDVSFELVLIPCQVDKIVGKAAPGEFIEKLEELANAHHDDLELDVIRAYFFGARFIVEVRGSLSF